LIYPSSLILVLQMYDEIYEDESLSLIELPLSSRHF